MNGVVHQSHRLEYRHRLSETRRQGHGARAPSQFPSNPMTDLLNLRWRALTIMIKTASLLI
jgi:hypothetical protein